jgi:hypothetical protein
MTEEQAHKLLDNIATPRMVQWQIEEFKKSHPSLYAVVIESIQKAHSLPRKKEKKVVQPPTLEEVKIFFKDNGYSEDAAVRAFNHYEQGKDEVTGQWRDSQGTPVVIWKQKVRTNWFNDKNKIGAFTPKIAQNPTPSIYGGNFFDKDKKQVTTNPIQSDANGFGKEK